MHAYWRAANYLSVGQIYLLDNPLLQEPLTLEHIKPRLLGHWGTTPGLNFVYVHLNRVIKKYDLDMIYICGPGHGGPGMVANTYLEGTYSEVYPNISQDAEGMQKLFKQFSFPGGIPSHAAPETPGSIHEGGELGYAVSHAYGAAFDNPGLIVACVVGDGEAETGPLATAWHSNKFLNPITDGAVLPILHLNGYKIANPTVLARISPAELFDQNGMLRSELAQLTPSDYDAWVPIPMPTAASCQSLESPFIDYRLRFKPYVVEAEPTRVMGQFLFDIMKLNMAHRNFRVFGPDETASNRLTPLFDVKERIRVAATMPEDDHLAPDGQVIEILSEHTCQGWLEGYLLTGCHGSFNTYEAFVHIVDSMFNQHAKWLEVTSREILWRRSIASLNYLLSSHVWRQDHNGFSHQDPGFIDRVEQES